MSGIKTKLDALVKAFKEQSAEYEKKKMLINEFRRAFIKQGYSPWMAINLAEEKYKQLHK